MSVPPTTGRALRLDADFDSGSLRTADCRIDGDTVRLAGRDNFNTGFWKWLYFRLDGAAGRRLVFELPDCFESSPDRLAEHRMVYSHDDRAYRFFEHGRLADGVYRFWNDRPLEHDTVYIAYGLPYRLARLTALVDELRQSPWVSPTPSAGGDLVLGMSPGGADDLGRTIPSHPIYGFRVTGPAELSEDRPRIVLMCGVHPNETLASHTLEGLLRFVVGEDPRAAALRRRAELLVYPMVNPDGRFAGYNRSTVQHPGRDANRLWRDDLWADADEPRIVGQALRRDAGRSPRYFIDLHSWTDTKPHFGILSFDEGFQRDPFWVGLRRLEPELAEADSGWSNPSTETFAFKDLAARFAMTFETMFRPHEPEARYHRLGANMAIALGEALAG